MNTATRVIGQGRFQSTLPTLQIQRPRMINLVLIVTLLISAFAVIYIKDLNRRLFIQYHSVQNTHEKLYEDWGKLLLEQSTWSAQSRVQKIAQNRLGMNIPSPQDVIVLKR